MGSGVGKLWDSKRDCNLGINRLILFPSFFYLSSHSSVCLSIHPSVHSSTHSFTYPSILPSVHPSAPPSIHLYIHPSTHPSVHLRIHTQVCLAMKQTSFVPGCLFGEDASFSLPAPNLSVHHGLLNPPSSKKTCLTCSQAQRGCPGGRRDHRALITVTGPHMCRLSHNL